MPVVAVYLLFRSHGRGPVLLSLQILAVQQNAQANPDNAKLRELAAAIARLPVSCAIVRHQLRSHSVSGQTDSKEDPLRPERVLDQTTGTWVRSLVLLHAIRCVADSAG
mgnify:CR=1 FL=1